MRFVGAKVTRVEDRRILTGRGCYVDDLRLPRMLHAAFVRSPAAHALVTGVDCAAARECPGVVAVVAGEEMATLVKPITVTMAVGKVPELRAMATDKVRLVGDLVAIVVAESRAEAEDAAELVEVSLDPLPVVASYEAALDPGGPVIFDDVGSNVLANEERTAGEVDAAFAAAGRVVEMTFRQHRVAPVPMETRGFIADYDPGTDELTLHASVQTPDALRMSIADALEVPMERVRVLVPDIGGAFGLKGCFGREVYCVAAVSRQLGRPVKWSEDRYEHLLGSGQAREEMIDIEVAVADDGTLLGMRAHLTMDQGAYPGVPYNAAAVTAAAGTLLPGPYHWQAYEFRRTVVATNKCTYVPYRGPWAIETWVRERVLDEVARELGLDPVDIRRRNMVAGDARDRLVTGPSLASVSSRQSLERALAIIGYDEFRREQAAARADGRFVGLGFATFIEAAPGPADMRAHSGAFAAESARVKIESDGHLTVVTAQVPQGQGHETTLAQVAADEMGIPFEHVRVLHGDTRFAPFKFIGSGGSLSATWAGGAVRMSTRKVKEKVLAIASELLEVDAGDLEIDDGMVAPRGVPAKAIPLAQIAMMATMKPDSLPDGAGHVLEAQERYRGDTITGSGWSGGTHACTVEVDLETGHVAIGRYVVAEDCGRVINPAIVDGQVRGGTAQGIGEVLYEHAAYDADGNFLASTFMDYLLPTAVEIPHIEIEHLETDDGEFSSRGVGEGGAIVAPAALSNAIADALAPLGARVDELYLPPSRILELAGVIPVDR
jgi:carbon-monoxide dehydrogenase large subunit